ncbi:M15 family metallopeptidase [Tepidibacillus fermentans]|nr:M15 family metallopeptidase [Tepidibacillus fermentans]
MKKRFHHSIIFLLLILMFILPIDRKSILSTDKSKPDIIVDQRNKDQRNESEYLILVNKRHHLPEDYVPQDLTEPNVPFSFKGNDPKKMMRKEAAGALESLFQAAKKENLNLFAVSGYRSYQRQKAIFAYNASIKGAERANQTSAYPGESEHQTGLAMDVSSSRVNFQLNERFGDTPEGRWLAEHAYEFGFIIRYPKGKEEITGYQYEPWHIRYVGKKPAKEMKEKQMTLEEYLEE